MNELVFFRPTTATTGREVAHGWTAAGTMMVRDINPGTRPRSRRYSDIVADVNGELIFAADDGSHRCELWTSDGT